MTIKQGAIMSKYRNDCSEINRLNRYAWEIRSVSLACIGEQNEPDLIGK